MLSLNNVSVYFKNHAGLLNISIGVNKGDFVYIVGPTGAGKTTLLRTIYMDLIPDEGYVQFGEYSSLTIKRRRIPYVRRQIGVVFQDFKILEDRTAFGNIVFALGAIGLSLRTAKEKAIRALTNVGLKSKKDSYPFELSQGELQRTCIARAIANNPLIILADEPTGNLDPKTAHEIFSLLKKLNERGIAVITATHNYRIIRDFPGRIIFLKNGRRVEKI